MSFDVKKRHVFYFSGFDPRGPAYYQRLFRLESIKQAAINKMPLTIHSLEASSALSKSWQIQSQSPQAAAQTTYEFMRWDDIIRRHWQRNEVVILLQYLHAAWVYFKTGALRGVLKASWPPFVTSLLPMLVMVLLIISASFLAYGTSSLATRWQLPAWIAATAGIGIFFLIMQCGRLIERRVNSFWLLRIFAFTVKQGQRGIPELEARLDTFARHIADHIQNSDDDEILIVGHSTGTIIAVSALARALAIYPELAKNGPRISLVTLGHCIPILSLLPHAQRFRDELLQVANIAEVDWIDFTAPTDGACFAFVDPVALPDLPGKNEPVRSPKLLSPRYASLFSAQEYARMKRNWYRHHFQYLMAGEKAGDYDYFAITTGNMTLAERFRSKPSITDFTRLRIFK